MATTPLRTTADIAEYLAESEQPIFFISRTPNQLLGLDRWVKGFSYIALRDGWDGANPNVFSPKRLPSVPPRGGAAIVNWLLQNAEVQDRIASRTPAGMRAQVVAPFIDGQTERICERLGYELILPSSTLRNRLDSKIVTTQLGNEAGVPSVPNIMGRASTWSELRALASSADLGEDLVVQTPYGNSGATTYFVANETDFGRIASKVHDVDIKVMKRINHVPLAVDAVLTSSGVVIGPIMSDITGHPELTLYRGGCSGNESFTEVISEQDRSTSLDMIRRFGERLAAEGYRGCFGIDLLLDTDSGEIYLGEINPRLTGSTPISNLGLFSGSGLPLFAYHLIEFSGQACDIDTEAISSRSAVVWSHLMIQHTDGGMGRVLDAPRTGRYRIGADGGLTYVGTEQNWYDIESANDAFFLRICSPGELRMPGDDLGVFVTHGRLQGEQWELTDRAHRVISEVKGMYRVKPVSPLTPLIHRVVHRVRALTRARN